MMTSVTRSAGRSARTRPMADASLRVGMMTDTRTRPGLAATGLAGAWLKSPPRRGRPTLRQPRVDAPGSARASHGDRKGCHHRNQQFPDPGCSPLRYPKASEVQECHESGRAREQADNKKDAERDFGDRLQGSRHRGMARRQSHHRFPRGRRMTVLDVVVDKTRVARRSVEAFPQILEENPHQHRANRHPHDCQTVRCLACCAGYLISQWDCVCRHREPRNFVTNGCYTRKEVSIGVNFLVGEVMGFPFRKCLPLPRLTSGSAAGDKILIHVARPVTFTFFAE